MKDYYNILGVEEWASEEEIRARWIESIKHSPPGLGRAEGEDQKIKEINEAYEILKNESTRLDYDLERALKRFHIKKAQRAEERGIHTRKIIVRAGMIALFLIVGFIGLKWLYVGNGPKFGVRDEKDRVSGKKTASQIPSVKEKSKVQGNQEVPKENKKKVNPPERKEIVSVSPQRSSSRMESESKKKEEPIREILPRAVAPVQVEEKVLAREEPRPAKEPDPQVLVKSGPPVPPPPLVKEEEVKRFFSNYIDRYHRKDIDGFLSLFSTGAVQNQKDGLEGIRTIYTKFFDQSRELRYQVKGMKTEIYQNAVEVKARFRVDQKLKKSGEEKVWQGDIRWVLVKEDGILKIQSLDYQNEKSPEGRGGGSK